MEEYVGEETIKGVQMLNLMGEFELQKMKYGASFICPTISIVYALFS